MKNRIGHVSNSSSSSFIIYGFEFDDDKITTKEYLIKLFGIKESDIPEDEDELLELFYESKNVSKKVFLGTNSDDGASEDKHIIGSVIAEWADEDYLEDCDYSIDELNERLSDITEKLGLDQSNAKIIVGTKCC